MNINLNSGYGAALAKALHGRVGPSGRLFIVAKAQTPFYDQMQELFSDDVQGVPRFHSTIAAAVARCTANAGDVILVAPGYTETRTAALDLNVAGISVIGVGRGSNRPTITGNFAGDAVTISAANVLLENFVFAAPLTDAQTAAVNIDATGDYATVRLCHFIGSVATENIVDIITIVAGANGVTIEDNTMYNITVAVNSGINIEGAVADLTIRRNRMVLEVVAGAIIDGGAATNLYLEDNTIVVTGTSKSAIVLDSNPTGFALRNNCKGTNTTLASNVNYGNALALFENRTAEDFSVQGAVIPAADTD